MYDPVEQNDLLSRFMLELHKATRDGGKKRKKGQKPPWYEEHPTVVHFAATLRHIARWIADPNGRDEDSGAHHLVAAAWRLLAIVCIQTGNYPDSKYREID